jgi:hypothetical protein
MAYEIVLGGRAEQALRAELAEHLGPDAVRIVDGLLTLSIRDQSALVAIIGQLNDLNVPVEVIRHVGSAPQSDRTC